jgi:mannose-6-phosphate isomerase-like protein (cupin superfamily)
MGDPLRDDSWSIGKGVTMTILQNPLRTRVHATGEEPFLAPPHWHLWHEEHHVILKGRIRLTQNGVTHVLGPEDGEAVTPARVVHSLESFPGEEVIIEETTRPSVDTVCLSTRHFLTVD